MEGVRHRNSERRSGSQGFFVSLNTRLVLRATSNNLFLCSVRVISVGACQCALVIAYVRTDSVSLANVINSYTNFVYPFIYSMFRKRCGASFCICSHVNPMHHSAKGSCPLWTARQFLIQSHGRLIFCSSMLGRKKKPSLLILCIKRSWLQKKKIRLIFSASYALERYQSVRKSENKISCFVG